MTANVAAHTVLVTNRRATRSMLAMTRRPSATTPGNVAKRLSSSTSSATDFAADVPEPMAIPRSASLSASVSLTPSPVIATTSPWLWAALTSLRLTSGVTRPNTAMPPASAANPVPSVSMSRASIQWSADGMPQRPAIADTVRGLSPEITLVDDVLGLEVGDRLGGVGADLVGAHDERGGDEVGRHRPRRLQPARRLADDEHAHARHRRGSGPRSSAGVPWPRRTSGAPRYHAPSGWKSTALYLYAEANGIRSRTAQPVGSGRAAPMAAIVGSGCGSAAASAPSAASTGRSWSSTCTSSSTTAPVVSVPVLSVASSVTRASVSTACSCCTSTFWRPSRITATAWARLSSSTRPCGTRATRPATVPIRASSSSSFSP